MTDKKPSEGPDPDAGSAGDGAAAEAPPYNSQLQRARVRERVRIFTDEIEALWRGAAPGAKGNLAGVTLDNFLKWTRLNEFRAAVFEGATGNQLVFALILGLITAVAAPLVLSMYVFGANGQAAPDPAITGAGVTIGAILVLVGFGVVSWLMSMGHVRAVDEKVRREMDNYLSGVRTLTADIRYRIGEAIRDESATVQDSGSNLKAVVYSDAAAEPVQKGAVDMMRSWRRLERLPYYLRHRWDLYFFHVTDSRDLSKYKVQRLPPALLLNTLFGAAGLFLILGLIAAVVAVGANAGTLWAMQSGAMAAATQLAPMPGLWLFAATSALAFYVYVWGSARHLAGVQRGAGRQPHRYRILYLLSPIMAALCLICVIYFAAVLIFGNADPIDAALAEANLLSDGVSVMVRTVASTALVSAFVIALIARKGVKLSRQQGECYKHMSNRAAAHIVMALQTHQKRDVIKQFKAIDPEFSPPDFLKLLDDEAEPGEDWNGWSVGYEEERHAALLAEGYSDGEASVEIATDPLIYVGEASNRRLEVCKFDPTPRLLAVIPDIRRGGEP